MTTPEKALFDLCYVSAAHSARQRRIPELELPTDFDRKEIARWVERIASPRLRTLTSRGIDHALRRALR